MGLLVMLIVGAIAGWLAGQILKGSGQGLIVNMVIGVLGAVVAGFLLPALGVGTEGGLIWQILTATFGAVVVLVVVGLVQRRG